jgi:hypothetical protein
MRSCGIPVAAQQREIIDTDHLESTAAAMRFPAAHAPRYAGTTAPTTAPAAGRRPVRQVREPPTAPDRSDASCGAGSAPGHRPPARERCCDSPLSDRTVDGPARSPSPDARRAARRLPCANDSCALAPMRRRSPDTRRGRWGVRAHTTTCLPSSTTSSTTSGSKPENTTAAGTFTSHTATSCRQEHRITTGSAQEPDLRQSRPTSNLPQ